MAATAADRFPLSRRLAISTGVCRYPSSRWASAMRRMVWVDRLAQGWVIMVNRHGDEGFQPFVRITIVPTGSPMFAWFQPRSDLEVVNEVRRLGALHNTR